LRKFRRQVGAYPVAAGRGVYCAVSQRASALFDGHCDWREHFPEPDLGVS
jgi:hypothetical protein